MWEQSHEYSTLYIKLEIYIIFSDKWGLKHHVQHVECTLKSRTLYKFIKSS